MLPIVSLAKDGIEINAHKNPETFSTSENYATEDNTLAHSILLPIHIHMVSCIIVQ